MQIRLRTPDRVRAQQLGLNAENVAVAAAEVVHRLDAGLLLDQLAGDLGAHAGAGARTVGNVDAIDAVLGTESRAGDFPRRIHAARRQDLDEGDELARRQLGAELATSAPTGTWLERLRLRLRLFHRHRQLLRAPAAASALRSGSA